MSRRPRISVCMAVYNGIEHVDEQLRSALVQLGPDDEVVVVDDGSTDGTRDLLAAFDDPRLRVHLNETNLGYVGNFERALGLATGDILMLADQDDLWPAGRVESLVNGLATSLLCVGNCQHFGGTPGPFQRLRLRPESARHHLRNILGIIVGYRLHWGSAMAMRRELLQMALPFPEGMRESHDQWLALVANIERSVTYLAENTVLHRLHADNLTPKAPRGAAKIVRARIQFLVNLMTAIKRHRRAGIEVPVRQEWAA